SSCLTPISSPPPPPPSSSPFFTLPQEAFGGQHGGASRGDLQRLHENSQPFSHPPPAPTLSPPLQSPLPQEAFAMIEANMGVPLEETFSAIPPAGGQHGVASRGDLQSAPSVPLGTDQLTNHALPQSLPPTTHPVLSSFPTPPLLFSQEAFAIIEANMGVPLEETFSAISPEPVAAASLGQVYRARLRASGAEVAVKVLGPGIEPVIYRDLFLFRTLASFLNCSSVHMHQRPAPILCPPCPPPLLPLPQVLRPGIEPVIYRDLFLFRTLASFLNGISIQKLGCNAELIVDEFGEKLLEELDYRQEARNIQSFYENFLGDPTVKIPLCYAEMSGERVLVMEWIDGIRCTDPQVWDRRKDRGWG
ncbi:unnamed protein product, partial [Closterium sp. NIES-54]